MKRILLIAIVFFSVIHVQVAQVTHDITVDNTVVISNETDESFCRDFSPFLNKISLEWVILKEKALPDSIDKKQSHYAQELSRHEETIAEVVAEAREKGEVPVRQHVLNKIKNPHVSFIIPFPHYYLRFAPSGTVTFNGKIELVSIDTPEIFELFQRKRILRLITKEIKKDFTDPYLFMKMVAESKVLCFGVGINVMKLRKHHPQGSYSVIIPEERL